MITFEHGSLKDYKHLFDEFIKLARLSVGMDEEKTARQLDYYTNSGCDVILVKDEDKLIGYTIHGEVGQLIRWVDHPRLKIAIVKAGGKNVHMSCHIHILKEYWKKGLSTKLFCEYSKAMLAKGSDYALQWGYLTDELASYSLSRKGTKLLEGFLDHNGRQVGIRSHTEFLKAYDK